MKKSALNYYKYCNQKTHHSFLPMFEYIKASKIYRGVEYVSTYYIYKGVIISERAGYSESVIDGFFDGVKNDSGKHYHCYIRPREALKNGLELLAMANNMTTKQINWAMTHDWYYYAGRDSVTGVIRVWVYSNRPEGGILPFSDYQKLRKWAGY